MVADILHCMKRAKRKPRISQRRLPKYYISFLDCTTPFKVGIYTQAVSDVAAATTNLKVSRGKFFESDPAVVA